MHSQLLLRDNTLFQLKEIRINTMMVVEEE